MAVSFVSPLETAWGRVRRVLFDPFRLEVWLVIGFAAFLAGLVEWGLGRTTFPGLQFRISDDSLELFRPPFRDPGHWFDAWGWGWLLWAPLVALGLLITLVLLWVGSRGKFVFLENMVLGRPAIVDPWSRLGRLGDSLFLWRLVFHLAFAVIAALVAAPMVLFAGGWPDGPLSALAAVQVSLAAVLWVALAAIYIVVGLLLDDFVVPLMYRDSLGAMAAWGRLLELVRREAGSLVVYLVLVVLARAALIGAIALLALPTCCILPAVLAIPYVGSVLLLPVSGLYRLYSVEFLGQFGDTWRLPGPPAPGGASMPPEAGPAGHPPVDSPLPRAGGD